MFAVAALVVCAASAQATSVIENGDFETGDLSGWTALNDTFNAASSYGMASAGGSFHALLEARSAPNLLTASSSSVSSFLGLADGAIHEVLRNPAPSNTNFTGSAMMQTVSVQAGDTMTFDFNFASNTVTQAPTAYDTAFL